MNQPFSELERHKGGDCGCFWGRREPYSHDQHCAGSRPGSAAPGSKGGKTPKLMERADLPPLGSMAGCGKKTIAHKKLLPCTMETSVSIWGLCQKNKANA